MKILVGHIVSFLSCLCLLCIFTQCANTKEVEGSYVIKTDKVEGIVCTNYKEWSWALPKNCGFWRPGKEEVLKGEAAIERYLLDGAGDRLHKIASKLSDYHRQYVGIIVNGQRRIFYVFVCNGNQYLGRNDKPAIVKDGGDCFFEIKYDVQTDRCDSLYLHGEA